MAGLAAPVIVCQLAEPCGAIGDTAAAVIAGVVAGAAVVKLAHTYFSSEQSLIRAVAKAFGISATKLSNAIHAWKRAHGMGGADNLTKEQIEEIAREVQQHLWDGTE